MASIYPGPSELGPVSTAVMSTTAHYDTNAYAQQQQTPPSQGHTPQDQQQPPSISSVPPQQSHQQHQSVTLQPSSQPRSVKRPRPVKSCTECRKRKLKCDRLCPCSQCRKSSRLCKYAPDNDSNYLSDASDTEAGDLRPVKRVAVGNSTVPTTVRIEGGLYAPARSAPDGIATATFSLLEELMNRMDRMESHILRQENADRSDEGRESKWEKGSGGIEVSPDTVRGLSIKNGGSRTRFFGPASSRVLLNLFDEAKDFMRDHTKDPDSKDVFTSFRKLHKLLRTEFQKSLTPITVFVDSMMPIQKRMVDILPKKHVCDMLIRGYLDNNETLYRVIHAPSFLKDYNRYWEGSLQSEAFLPKLLGVLSIASRFETKSRGLSHERSEGVHLPTAAALVRMWLNNLRGKQLVEMDTLQVELLWLLTMRMIKEHARDGWPQLGSILRMAMGMGLHRDPTEFGTRFSPFYTEMRRRLWATVADLDYYISNDCNLPSLLREEDSTTGPPRNLDDADIYPDMTELPPTKPFGQVTDNHVQAYAAITFGLRKRAVALVNRVDKTRDWSEILSIARKLERHLDDINSIFPNCPVDHVRKARYWRCRGLLEAHLRQPLMTLYRPFVLGVPGVPTEITRAYLRHTLDIVQGIEELDPSMPDYESLVDLCHVSVKSEAVLAAMSVCYYIRSGMRPDLDPASASVQQALRASPPDSEATAYPSDGIMWPTHRLINGVERVLEFLIQNIKRGDTKDIICLSVVLESVKTPEPRADEMSHGLRVVLDSCLRAANCSLERLANAQPDAATQMAEASYGGGLMASSVPGFTPPAPGNVMNSITEDDGWVFWDGWD